MPGTNLANVESAVYKWATPSDWLLDKLMAAQIPDLVCLFRRMRLVLDDKMIKDIIASDDKLANMVSICMKDSIEWNALRLLTKAMFKKKKYVKEILSRVKLDGNGGVTRWNLYNAVTSYVSRAGSRLKPQIDTWLQNKAQKILKTPGTQLIEEMVKVDEKKSA